MTTPKAIKVFATSVTRSFSKTILNLDMHCNDNYPKHSFKEVRIFSKH